MHENDPLTERIIGCAIEVHRALGPGLLESTYEACFSLELSLAHLTFRRQAGLPLNYKSLYLENAYRCDLVVENQVILELKVVDKLLMLHDAQIKTYMKLSQIGRGLIINFNSVQLKDGIHRHVLPGFIL